jgi:VIT1/CCC1 family predicted Fe2+/Mn2+ transporter
MEQRLKEEKNPKSDLIKAQINEITEHLIYLKLSELEKEREKSQILKKISDEEFKHYKILSRITGKEPGPLRLKIFLTVLLARIFGYQFVLKKMENGEKGAENLYAELKGDFEELELLARDEEEHEKRLISLINEKRLQYMSSVVLGLNDGIVELLGTVAGLSIALKNSSVVGLTAGIMGIAACLSMSASEYLSTKVESDRSPYAAASYTAASYFAAVLAVITPFLLIKNPFFALFTSFFLVLILVAFLNYYISIVRDESFGKRLLEMLAVVLITSSISFLIGFLVNKYFGIEV